MLRERAERRGEWQLQCIYNLPGLWIDFKLYLTKTESEPSELFFLRDLLRFWVSGNHKNPTESFKSSYGHK